MGATAPQDEAWLKAQLESIAGSLPKGGAVPTAAERQQTIQQLGAAGITDYVLRVIAPSASRITQEAATSPPIMQLASTAATLLAAVCTLVWLGALTVNPEALKGVADDGKVF